MEVILYIRHLQDPTLPIIFYEQRIVIYSTMHVSPAELHYNTHYAMLCKCSTKDASLSLENNKHSAN